MAESPREMTPEEAERFFDDHENDGPSRSKGPWMGLLGLAALVGVLFLVARDPKTTTGRGRPAEPTPPSPGASIAFDADSLLIGGIRFVRVDPGDILLGSPREELGRERDLESLRNAEFREAFYLSAFEITQGQFEEVLQTGNPPSPEESHLPITGVSWDDAVAFCRALSQKHGRIFRLPRESEWEFACRAGDQRMFGVWRGGVQELDRAVEAWRKGDQDRLIRRARSTFNFHSDGAQPVGSFEPNPHQLFDMHGNVWEWCGLPGDGDPKDAPSLRHRPIRGGAYSSTSPLDCRSSKRAWQPKNKTTSSIGFRVLLEDSL